MRNGRSSSPAVSSKYQSASYSWILGPLLGPKVTEPSSLSQTSVSHSSRSSSSSSWYSREARSARVARRGAEGGRTMDGSVDRFEGVLRGERSAALEKDRVSYRIVEKPTHARLGNSQFAQADALTCVRPNPNANDSAGEAKATIGRRKSGGTMAAMF
ncbi:hypothetical protein ACHAWF_001094 [Thalassiosira exigua]